MKKTILIIITTLFITNYSAAANHTAECEKITGALKTGEKIDCLLNIKKKIAKDKISKSVNKGGKSIETLNEKKKKFDEKNKTLWKMFKNTKNNDK
tara:strand:- start:2615 stop:2902 length:288 start_codon:yes stop_codon:yes gene_type:complete